MYFNTDDVLKAEHQILMMAMSGKIEIADSVDDFVRGVVSICDWIMSEKEAK
jgi:hypothetical protein